MSQSAHPAPHRHNINFALLTAALIGTPAVWSVRLVVNYAIDSHFCFPGDRRSNAIPGWTWPTLIGLDLLAILVAAAALLISLDSWRRTQHELAAATGPLIEIGEGRTRFLSLWGVMISAGFLVALIADLITLWITPVCG
jgi:hypothetical protein